jgi:hypothetical protein
MHNLKRIEIELPNSNSEINQIEKPNNVEVIIIDDEFLNATGRLFEIVITFILIQVTSVLLNKVGEDIYEYLKKIILKNNESKNKSELKFQIKNKDFIVNFSGNNLNRKNTEIALKEFGNFLDKIQEYSTNDQILVFNENSNKWEFEDIIKSNWIYDLRNNAMKDFND